MSRISDLLQQIMDAVYGKDVRGAIHDSIEECYSDVSTAKTLAQDATANANAAAATANTAAANANAAKNAANAAAASAGAALDYVATVENSSPASAAHAKGSCLIYNGDLYEAIDDIAIGDTLTVGTNIEAIPGGLGSEVTKLKNAIDGKPDTKPSLSNSIKRYIGSTGRPSATTSNNWRSYIVDVTGVDLIDLETKNTGASATWPLWSFFDIDAAEADATSLRDDTQSECLGIGPKLDVSESLISVEDIPVPAGAKTMLVACTANYVASVSVTAKYIGIKDELKKDDERLKALEGGSQSPFYRDVRWGPAALNKYYHSVDTGETPFSSNQIMAADYFAAFNELVEDYEGYAVAHEMGTASDGITMMYYYTFDPLTGEDVVTGETQYRRPKIIIGSGQHGFEQASVFGLYFFAKDLLENWEGNETLDYIRNHVQLIIMPLLNPYGFNQRPAAARKNANGVDINRNYGTETWSGGSSSSDTYGGEEPFSEVEAQYARDVILANLDALYLADFHNNGRETPSVKSSYLWHSFRATVPTLPYHCKAIDAGKWHIDEMSGHAYKDYPTVFDYEIVGHLTADADSHGTLTNYAREQGIMSATIEGANAFDENGRYGSPVQHFNADLIGNWIRCLLATFQRYEK